MTDRISVLRARLQLCSPDLNLLTVKDLAECKWSVQKRVFLALFSSSSHLLVASNELQTLIDQHNEELGKLKAQSTYDRSLALEADCRFRTAFMRTVLGVLTTMKWPPATKAFSDPFDDLCHEKSVTLDAVEHIVNIAFHHQSIFSGSEVVSPNRKPLVQQKKEPAAPPVHSENSQYSPRNRDNIEASPVSSSSISYPVNPKSSSVATSVAIEARESILPRSDRAFEVTFISLFFYKN
jgi:hypothetical protein